MKVFTFPSFVRIACAVSLFIVLLGSQLWGQTAGGSLHGQVTDPSGAAVTKADVQLVAPDGKIVTTTTSQTGTYEVKGLASGKYGIKVTAKGFALYEVDGIDVAPGQSQKIDISLSIEVQQQNINVSDQAIGLDTSAENNTTQMVLTGKDLDALSDDPDELSTDLQALAGPSAGPNGGQIYIDGFTGGTLPPKASIREVRVNSNPFSAEYDHLGYGRVEIFTKPGMDKFRGQVSTSFNDNSFNARNPFLGSGPKPAFQSRQFSGNLAGPLTKKISFTLDYE